MAVYKITEEQLTAYVKEGLGDGEIARKVGPTPPAYWLSPRPVRSAKWQAIKA
jgi:hypothetical protein